MSGPVSANGVLLEAMATTGLRGGRPKALGTLLDNIWQLRSDGLSTEV
jgi:hypothetical protein